MAPARRGRARRDDRVSAAVADGAEAVVERMRAARADRVPLRIVGAGTWLDAGRPCTTAARLDLTALAGVAQYEPGDLVLTAGAATPLAEIALVTRAEGQWLPLDPFGSTRGTIGATVATASWGPLASAYGTPRDQVLGCTFVTGAGEVVHAGGRVVKNVAGFDLTRLVTGAWGTLGAITSVTVRLRALPEVERTVAVDVGADAAWRWLRTAEFTPLAAELLTPRVAAAVGAGDRATFLVRIGGNEALVRAALDAARTLGDTRELDAAVWPALATAEPAGSAVVRMSTRPSRVAALWERAAAVVERVGGYAHATVQRGVVRCVVPHDPEDGENARLRGIIGALRIDATLVGERLPAQLWSSLVPAAAADPLSMGVRAAFDPDQLLNPGILGEPA
jgi:glycolate oxidase FAD binding subunit